MRIPLLHTRWLPIVLSVVAADLNFWYYASTGENDADYAGMAFFALLGLYYLQSLLRRRELSSAVAGVGAVLALGMMALRETGTFDPGYVPPYGIFILFVLLGRAFDRSRASKA